MKKNVPLALALFLCAFISSSLFAQQNDCTGFRTQTQGGWGAKPAGNNPGVYVHANFASAFPNGLTIGCGGNTLTLTSAQAVTDFLPSGSTPSLLPVGNTVNPGGSYSNVLAGQLVTAVLNVGFDANDPNFSSNTTKTGDLVIVSGTFAGLTINQLIAEANKTIGGCSSKYTPSQLNTALSSFNENYDNGTKDNGYTTCPVRCTIAVSGESKNVSCYGSKNGSIDITVTGANGSVTYLWNDGSTVGDRNGLAPGSYSVTVKDSKGCEASASFTITEPAQLKITRRVIGTSSPEACDGYARIRVFGGVAPYKVVWSDGYKGENRTGLCNGTYIVTVTDAIGCTDICRVKMICEADAIASGEITSDIITRTEVSATVSPNPTRGLVQLKFSSKTSNTALVNIYDMSGKRMASEKFGVSTGTNTRSMDLGRFSKGLYNVEVILEGKKHLVKVMLQ